VNEEQEEIKEELLEAITAWIDDPAVMAFLELASVQASAILAANGKAVVINPFALQAMAKATKLAEGILFGIMDIIDAGEPDPYRN